MGARARVGADGVRAGGQRCRWCTGRQMCCRCGARAIQVYRWCRGADGARADVSAPCEADMIRDELLKIGIQLVDDKDGTKFIRL